MTQATKYNPVPLTSMGSSQPAIVHRRPPKRDPRGYKTTSMSIATSTVREKIDLTSSQTTTTTSKGQGQANSTTSQGKNPGWKIDLCSEYPKEVLFLLARD